MARKTYKGGSGRSDPSDRAPGSEAVFSDAGGGKNASGGGGGELSPSGPKHEIARALYDFNAEDGEEMSLKIGDIVTVVDKDGDWWQGKIHGDAEHTVGWFPAQ